MSNEESKIQNLLSKVQGVRSMKCQLYLLEKFWIMHFVSYKILYVSKKGFFVICFLAYLKLQLFPICNLYYWLQYYFHVDLKRDDCALDCSDID